MYWLGLFSSHPEKISQFGVVTIGFTEHDMPFVVRKETMPKRKARQVWIRNYKNYNVQSFNEYLWQLLWSVINVFEDPQVMWEIFVYLFTEAADKHAPWMHKCIKGLDTPYITGELRKHMQERDMAKLWASKSNDTVLWDKDKKLCNKVTSLTEKALRKVLPQSNIENATLLCETVSTLPLFILQIVMTISSIKLDQNW